MPATEDPGARRVRRRHGLFEALSWGAGFTPAVAVLSVASNIGGIRAPVGDAVTSWVVDRVDAPSE